MIIWYIIVFFISLLFPVLSLCMQYAFHFSNSLMLTMCNGVHCVHEYCAFIPWVDINIYMWVYIYTHTHTCSCTHTFFSLSLSHLHRNLQIWVTESLKFRNMKCWLSDDIVFCSECAVKSGKTSRESGDKITLDAFIKVEEVFVVYHINTNMYIYVITIFKKKISSCSLCIPISDYLIGSCNTYAYPSLLRHLKLTKPVATLEWCQRSFE